MMTDILVVATGGALGAAARYAVGDWIADRLGPGFPWHTLLINVTGAFALGLLMALSLQRSTMHPHWRLFLGVGLLGGYTTFSTLSYETITLLDSGSWAGGLANMAGSGAAGLAAATAGIAIGRML